jgi:predicted amino acid dehydrogenase
MHMQGSEALIPKDVGTNRFAFVIHPLQVKYIHEHPSFGWTRLLPENLLEWIAAWVPPIYLSRMTGGQSPATAQRVEGYLYTLGATPRQMMQRSDRFTYNRLVRTARKAQRHGAKILGLGAFTSVVGDAGKTIARELDIAVTSGNSLTVYATIESAKQAVAQMGFCEINQGRVMVIGATGSIGSACARLLAAEVRETLLVSQEEHRLVELKNKIQSEVTGASVNFATSPNGLLGECDLIITATSSIGTRVMNIMECQPGAVICDVAQPADIDPHEAAHRPDVLLIKSGEVLLPMEMDWGYDMGLSPRRAYACLAETILLAMEGHFVDFTIGRSITREQVNEIARLFHKHKFELGELHSYDNIVTEEYLDYKRWLARAAREV